jgi:hypothetical protein
MLVIGYRTLEEMMKEPRTGSQNSSRLYHRFVKRMQGSDYGGTVHFWSETTLIVPANMDSVVYYCNVLLGTYKVDPEGDPLDEARKAQMTQEATKAEGYIMAWLGATGFTVRSATVHLGVPQPDMVVGAAGLLAWEKSKKVWLKVPRKDMATPYEIADEEGEDEDND